MVSNENEASLEDIIFVRDFLDIFPDDLLDLPPEIEVEFTIDLVLRANPISKADLKVQFQKLLDKMGSPCVICEEGRWVNEALH